MTPVEIVNKMMNQDHFSQWLGITVISIDNGKCILGMQVKSEMVNGFGIAHGGITFSLADSALAFASNSHGKHCVSIETSIHHLRPVNVGDQLTANCQEINRGKSLGLYEVKITNQDQKLVAFFKGQVKIIDKDWC
ncbi:MAG: hydroxyphenylacetyl-CoA thioesterase PaaI [Bacteroidetes bacterium]|nr:hydroxyphenylacetyl-CoA thioesterase PaaI [Bacteroidota bacterium]